MKIDYLRTNGLPKEEKDKKKADFIKNLKKAIAKREKNVKKESKDNGERTKKKGSSS